MSLNLLFLIVAFILFVLASVGVNAGRVNLIAAGFAFVVLAQLVGGYSLQ